MWWPWNTPIPPTPPGPPRVGEELLYATIAARRVQWDALVWQVPVISLTAQAFLFTIALGGETRQTARVIACALSLLVSFLCVTLMARHRQSEVLDAHWLEDFEARHWPHLEPVHGRPFQAARETIGGEKGFPERLVRPVRGYRTWIIGQMLMAAVASVILVISLGCWELLSASSVSAGCSGFAWIAGMFN